MTCFLHRLFQVVLIISLLSQSLLPSLSLAQPPLPLTDAIQPSKANHYSLPNGQSNFLISSPQPLKPPQKNFAITDYAGPYFYDTFVPTDSGQWVFTGKKELTTPGRTDGASLTLKEGASAEMTLIVPPNSNLTLSYWCRDEIQGPSYSRHNLFLDGEDTTPGIGGNNIICAESWDYKEQLIDKKYTADGEVTIRIEVATYPILSAQVGFDDVLVQGAIFPNDQAYTPEECPVCSNTQRHHYIGGPIDSYSGNYSYAQVDINIATLVNSEPLFFKRTYNSMASGYGLVSTLTQQSTYSLPLAYGWVHNYDAQLLLPNNPAGEENTVIFKSMGGSRLRFEAQGDETFNPYPGINAQLSQFGSTYHLTTTQQRVYQFEVISETAVLSAIQDPQGNQISLSYSQGKLSQLSDPYGLHWLAFDYEQDRLSQIRDHSGRVVQYGYDNYNRLSVMTNARGLTWQYIYSGTTPLLHAVVDPDGRVVERTFFNESGQTTRQENGAGKTVVTIAYPQNNVRVVSQNGQVLTDTYDVRGLLISQTDAEGHQHYYGLDSNFERIAAQDGNGNITAFAKNEVGLTTVVTDALGYRSVLTYNNRYNLTAFEDARGYVSHYTYDTNNNLRQVVNPLGATAVFSYNASGQVVASQNENGHITTIGYDSFGNTIAITDVLQSVNRFQYDNLGRLTHSIDPLGRIIFNEYDAADNLIRVTANYTPAHPQNYLNQYNLGNAYAYNGANQPILITDTVGHVTKYTYNQAGQLIETIENYVPNQPQNHQNEYNLITSYGFDAFARPIIVTDTIGRQTRTIYNALNQVEQSIVNYEDGIYDPAFPDVDLITTYYYDANANLVSTVDVLGRETRIIYDVLNRVDKVILNYQDGVFDPTFPDTDLITTYHYDPASNLSQLINPKGQVTAYQFDPLNRLETVIENYVTGTYNGIPDQDVITKYGYDSVGNRTAIVDANGYQTTYTFDPLNRLLSQTDPLSNTAHQNYDVLGNPIKTTKPGGTVITTTYNTANRLTAIDYSDTTPDVTFSYNAIGNVLTMTDGLTYPTTYQYNQLNQITHIKDGFNQTLTYQFDVLGRQTHLIYPDNRTLTYTYDLANRLQTLSDWDGGQYSYGYNGASELTTLTYPNRARATYNYDDVGRLTQIAYHHQNQILAQYDYTLDALGNRVQAVEHLVKPTIPTTNTTPITGTYIIYLPLVLKRGLPPAQIIDYGYDNLNRLTSAIYGTGETYAYTYDPAGNRLQQTINGDITTYQYDEANRLTKVNDVTYTWGDNGNLLSDGIRTFSYDAENRLTQVMSGSLSTQFEYNGFGDRTRKWVNGVETQYLLDPLGLTQVLAETTNGQSQFYVAGLAQYNGTEWAYQLPDPLGSVRQLVNVQGQVKLTQSYDPFGNLVEQIGSVQSGFGYTGQQHDPSAGLVYLRARYYDPATGRFISKDPFPGLPTRPQTHNPYPYVINNPINHTDPTGEYLESPWDLAMVLIDAAFIGVDAYYANFGPECDRDYWRAQLGLDYAALTLDLFALVAPGIPGIGAAGNVAVRFGLATSGKIRTAQQVTKGAQVVGKTALLASTTGSSKHSWLGQNVNVKGIRKSGRLKTYQESTSDLTGGLNKAKEVFETLTGRKPKIANPLSKTPTDRYVELGKIEILFRPSSRTGTPVIEVINHERKTVEKIHFN